MLSCHHHQSSTHHKWTKNKLYISLHKLLYMGCECGWDWETWTQWKRRKNRKDWTTISNSEIKTAADSGKTVNTSSSTTPCHACLVSILFYILCACEVRIRVPRTQGYAMKKFKIKKWQMNNKASSRIWRENDRIIKMKKTAWLPLWSVRWRCWWSSLSVCRILCVRGMLYFVQLLATDRGCCSHEMFRYCLLNEKLERAMEMKRPHDPGAVFFSHLKLLWKC